MTDKHTPTPWTDDLTPLIRANNPKLKINGDAFSVDLRVISEPNFQYAKHRVNMHDELVGALEFALYLASDDPKITLNQRETYLINWERKSKETLKKVRGES